MLKNSLQLKMGQQLSMTPQLQQAIRLLQLSSLDLELEIQQELDSNPLLEKIEEHETHLEQPQIEAPSGTPIEEIAVDEGLQQTTLPEELPSDTEWQDTYSSLPAATRSGSSAPLDNDLPYQGETQINLQDHLHWQMTLTPMSKTDRAIATAIIDAINPQGYLTIEIDEITDVINRLDVETEEILAVLKLVQQFEPLGCGSRSLQECLNLQLAQSPIPEQLKSHAKTIITHHLPLLANKDFRSLMKHTKLNEETLKKVVKLIQTLNPRPGSIMALEPNHYVTPDVSVAKVKGRWQVELNPDLTPKIRVNQDYAALVSPGNAATNQFIRGHVQEAKWFIKSIESRNETLLKVANSIVNFQQGFLEFGEEAMKPMILSDVAEDVDMHESTISRVTTQKYIHTPRGIFELKYFFSSHVSTNTGGECSSTAIHAFIKKLVSAENGKKPLSDHKITELLAEQGIKVARRTIAKYREALSIPPSNQRKSL